MCLVRGEKIAVFKDYNLNRHYETKHAEKYKNLTEAERARESEYLLANFKGSKDFFYKSSLIQGCSRQDKLCNIPQNCKKQ